MSINIFSSLPLWVIYILVAILILASIQAGILYAQYRLKRAAIEDNSAVNTLVGATLGLLAFMLAFTFGLTTSRFDAKKHFLLEEINTIETAWLRAGLVTEEYSDDLRKSIVEYVEIRLWFNNDKSKLQEAITRAKNVQNTIWSTVITMTQENSQNDEILALLIESVNDMFDNQTRRITIGADRIPDLIWIALFGLICIAMFEVGYLLGKSEKSNWVLLLALSISFSAIVIIIVDLDNSKGNITINNQPVIDLYERINVP